MDHLRLVLNPLPLHCIDTALAAIDVENGDLLAPVTKQNLVGLIDLTFRGSRVSSRCPGGHRFAPGLTGQDLVHTRRIRLLPGQAM